MSEVSDNTINPNKIKKIRKKIAKYLEEKRTDTTEFTHLSMGGLHPPGKFNIITKKDVKTLNKLLAEAYDNNLHYSILEKRNSYGPVIVDIDLEMSKVNYKKGTRLYDDKLLLYVCNFYRESIRKLCDVQTGDLNICVFEKEKISNKKENVKDGFHIIFPSLCLHYKVRHLIREYVVKRANESKMFNAYENEVSDIFDKSIVSSNNWLIYGCCKPNNSIYEFTRYLNYNSKELDLKSFGKNTKSIIKLLSLRSERWNEDNSNILNSNLDEEFVNDEFNQLDINHTEKMSEFDISQDKEEIIKNCHKLLGMLSKKRANNYHTWIRVGWALHNTDLSLLPKWKEFSKRSNKYKPGECEKRWRSMHDKGLTYRSLRMWAKEDNPEKYERFNQEQFELLLKKNEGLGTFWIAKALQNRYGDNFVCTNPDRNEWYEFKNNRWSELKGGGKLIQLMSSQFSNSYRVLVEKYNKFAILAPENEKRGFDAQADSYKKIANALMNISFKKKIMEEAKNLFYDPDFFERLDENHDIIGFKDGVYDLKLHKFRKGQPDDYLSLSTKVNFIPWNPNNKISKDILKFLKEILPNDKVRNYFLTVLSTCVSGDNNEEKIYFATGTGSNGKSVLFELISHGLGDYYISCPITILTGKRTQSSQASPELARFKGPRIGVFQEPNSGDKLNVGSLKEYTGNDKFYARKLHQDPIEIKPQIKLFMACNDLPEANTNDGGTWRRIRVIDFISKFVDKEDLDDRKKNMYLIDKTLKHKLPEWGPIFAGYLIHIYKNDYCKNKLVEPSEVLLATKSYRSENDYLREYFDFRIDITEDKKDCIAKRPIWNDFKNWFKEFKEGNKLPSCKKLYTFIDDMVGKPGRNKPWSGLMFKIDESLIDSDNEIGADLDA